MCPMLLLNIILYIIFNIFIFNNNIGHLECHRVILDNKYELENSFKIKKASHF